MKVFKLDSVYNPSTTLQDFASLAWTERYQTSGDFQLVVEDDKSILTILPLGTLISHTDTKEVMIVENHEIDRDSNKKLIVTVTGRSFETFAENRPSKGSEVSLYDLASGLANVYTSTGTADYIAGGMFQWAFISPYASADDIIPNFLVDFAIRAPTGSLTIAIKRESAYAAALEFLKVADAGVKIIRPNGAQTTLNLIIHDGLDLRSSIIFYAQYEDLEDAKYFWSIKDYKNYAQVATHTTARLYRDRNVATNQTGLNRRTIYVDADDLEGAYSPPTATDAVSARGQTVLDDHKMFSLLQARISNTAKPKFKINYDVGDLVTVFGEFSPAQLMRVTEHILTVDKSGVKGYPSLSVV